MPLGERLRATLSDIRAWEKDHAAEILLALLFAAPLAYFAAKWFEPPRPFTVHVVADSETSNETLDMFRKKTENAFSSLGRVPVIVVVDKLSGTTPGVATQKAEELIAQESDTLMVIGSARSTLIEESLPTYFKPTPPVPFISTVASDDDLLQKCTDCEKAFVPLIQLSPTNMVQSSSAVEYGIEQGRRKFLIVSPNGGEDKNQSYTSNLAEDYRDAIKARALTGALEVDEVKLRDLDQAEVDRSGADCVLYAGSLGEAQTLFNKLAAMALPPNGLMIIMADSVIQSRGTDRQIAQVFSESSGKTGPTIRFTNQDNADDYNQHLSTYDRDALEIAKTLIKDVNDHGVDLLMRTKSVLHMENVSDARRNMLKVMQENARRRTWYPGEVRPGGLQSTYFFLANAHTQVGGMFHVWRLKDDSSNVGQMDDVDHWHPDHEAAITGRSLLTARPRSFTHQLPEQPATNLSKLRQSSDSSNSR